MENSNAFHGLLDATTGGMPPQGVTMLSRWHSIGSGRGFAIAETDDPVALSRWCREWSDLMSFEVLPVINDEQIAEVLAQRPGS
jgi:hypothetical protein